MMGDSPNDPGVARNAQTLLILLTHVVRMGMDPAAAPKFPFPGRLRPTLGLSVGLRAWVFLREDPPSDRAENKLRHHRVPRKTNSTLLVRWLANALEGALTAKDKAMLPSGGGGVSFQPTPRYGTAKEQ